jgi:hypothetical protein
MNIEEFKNLKHDELVQPNYPGYSTEAFRILSINRREGLIEVNEISYLRKTQHYRYENLSRVKYSKVIDDKFNEVKKYTKQ